MKHAKYPDEHKMGKANKDLRSVFKSWFQNDCELSNKIEIAAKKLDLDYQTT